MTQLCSRSLVAPLLSHAHGRGMRGRQLELRGSGRSSVGRRARPTARDPGQRCAVVLQLQRHSGSSVRQPFSGEGQAATEEELRASSMAGEGRATAEEELRMAAIVDVPMEDARFDEEELDSAGAPRACCSCDFVMLQE